MARRASTRLPIVITEGAYSRAAIAAEMDGKSLAEFTEAALAVRVEQAIKRHREGRYAEACLEAVENPRLTMPRRYEFGLPDHRFGQDERGLMPFVRPAPEASGRYMAGRPSSRHHQKATGAQTRSTGPQAGAEPRVAAGAQRRGEHGEHPPVDRAEHRGITPTSTKPRFPAGVQVR